MMYQVKGPKKFNRMRNSMVPVIKKISNKKGKYKHR